MCDFKHAISKGGLAVINMSYDTKVSDMLHVWPILAEISLFVEGFNIKDLLVLVRRFLYPKSYDEELWLFL